MNHGENKEKTYKQASVRHKIFDRRLQMLLRKPYLTASEEIEMIDVKKKKLYYKDVMDQLASAILEKETD